MARVNILWSMNVRGKQDSQPNRSLNGREVHENKEAKQKGTPGVLFVLHGGVGA